MPINARIPEELYNQIQESDYKTNTECIIAALDVLFDNEQQGNNSSRNDNTALIQVLQDQIAIKDQQFHNLQMSQQALLTKLESKPLMIDAPGEQNKRWWKFWV